MFKLLFEYKFRENTLPHNRQRVFSLKQALYKIDIIVLQLLQPNLCLILLHRLRRVK